MINLHRSSESCSSEYVRWSKTSKLLLLSSFPFLCKIAITLILRGYRFHIFIYIVDIIIYNLIYIIYEDTISELRKVWIRICIRSIDERTSVVLTSEHVWRKRREEAKKKRSCIDPTELKPFSYACICIISPVFFITPPLSLEASKYRPSSTSHGFFYAISISISFYIIARENKFCHRVCIQRGVGEKKEGKKRVEEKLTAPLPSPHSFNMPATYVYGVENDRSPARKILGRA